MAFLELEGRRLELCEIGGDRAQPPLVFLHEGLGSVGLWRGFHERVAAATGRRTLAYSRFGHGSSGPPPSPRTERFMHDEALELLPDLLERLGAAEPVLVGHSDGASIALIYAGAHPVSGLALLAPHVFVEERTLSGIRDAREAFERGDLRERLGRYHSDPDVAFRGWCDVWLSDAFRSWNIEDALPGISCTLLLVQGRDDEYGTLAQLDAIERGVRGAVRRVVLPCGHQPHVERRAEALAAVVSFIRSL